MKKPPNAEERMARADRTISGANIGPGIPLCSSELEQKSLVIHQEKYKKCFTLFSLLFHGFLVSYPIIIPKINVKELFSLFS